MESQPIVSQGSTKVYNQVSAEQIATIFGQPVEPAETLKRRSESQLSSFYDLLVNSDDHLSKIIKRPTDKEKDGLPVIEGKARPLVVKALVDKGYALTTAEKLFSNMIRMREAYSRLQFIPQAGTPWDDAYTQATKALGTKTREINKAKRSNAQSAYIGAHIAQEIQRLAPEEMNDINKVAEASLRGRQNAINQQLQTRIDGAAFDAWNAIGGAENVPKLVSKLQEMLADWQTKQSATTVSPAGVPAAPEQSATQPAANQPARAAA